MSAIWMRARSNLKHGWRSVVALGVIAGLVGGVVMASTAAARRTSTAYDRFLVATGSPNAAVEARTARLPGSVIEKIETLPQVADATLVTRPVAVATDDEGHALFEGGESVFWAPFEHPGSRWLRPKVVSGRLPDPGRVDEVAVGYNPAPLVRLGDHIVMRVGRPGADELGFPRAPRSLVAAVPARVVGIVLMVTTLEPRVEGELFVTPAFQRAYGSRAMTRSALFVRLHHGAADAPAFAAAVARVAPDLFALDLSAEAGRAGRQSAPQTTALWLFAALAGLFGILLFALALSRAIFGESTENHALRALGMSGRQFVGVAAIRGFAVGLVGAVVAMVVAAALSPVAPFGLARLVEPHPGLVLDGVVTETGAVTLIVAGVLLSLPAAIRSAGFRADASGATEAAQGRPSRLATVLSRSGLPPTAAVGARLALEPGRGRAAVPVRSTLIAVTLSIAGLSLAFGFGASLHNLLETPRLYGIGWDLNVHFWAPSPGADAFADDLRKDAAVGAFSAGNILLGGQAEIVVGSAGHQVRTAPWGLDEVRGKVTPTVIEGRWPRTDTEITLGTKTLRAVRADVTDTIRVAGSGPSIPMRIVGRAVFPEIAPGAAGVGHGAGLTLGGLQRVVRQASSMDSPVAMQDVLIRLSQSADVRRLVSRLSDRLGESALIAPGDQLFTGLRELRSSESLPLVLSGVLALAAVLTLANTLVDSIRRRRRDLAVLKTIGFVRRQLAATVAWQASIIASIAVLLGLPLGVMLGRWGWNLLADHLAVMPEPVVPMLVLVLIPAAILLANLIAVFPGRSAARTRPAVVLRAE